MTLRLPILPDAREGFHQGIVRDPASRLAPQGSWYRAEDALCDVPGRIRRRAGVVAIGADGTRAADGSQYVTPYDPGISTIGPFLVGIGTPTSAGNQPGRVRVWDTSTGAGTDVDGSGVATNSAGFSSTLKAFQGPPTAHRGILCAASAASGEFDSVFWSGSTAKAGTTYSGGGFSATLYTNGLMGTAGVADLRTLSEVGHLIQAFGTDASSTACYYIGRITSLTATTAAIDPAPPTQITATILVTARAPGFVDTTNPGGSARNHLVGHFLLSHQGRLMVGAPRVAIYDGAAWSAIRPLFPRRFYWSNTKDETPSVGYKVYGYVFMAALGYEQASWEELPGTDPISGWVRTGDREVLIFTRYKTYALTGDLQSITAEVGQKSWALSERFPAIGCSAQNTIQSTPQGIVWADDRGIYLLTPGGGLTLLLGASAKWWRRKVGAAASVSPSSGVLSPSPYLGSAYARGTYFLSLRGASDGTFDTTLVIDLDTRALTTWNLPFQGSCSDPTVANKTWGMHYWKQGVYQLTKGSMVDLSAAFADQTLGDSPAATDSSSASTPHLILVSNTWTTSNALPQFIVTPVLRYNGPSSGGVAGSVYLSSAIDVRQPESAGWGSATVTLAANGGLGAIQQIPYRKSGQGLSLKIDVPAGGARFEVDRVEFEYQHGSHQNP